MNNRLLVLTDMQVDFSQSMLNAEKVMPTVKNKIEFALWNKQDIAVLINVIEHSSFGEITILPLTLEKLLKNPFENRIYTFNKTIPNSAQFWEYLMMVSYSVIEFCGFNLSTSVLSNVLHTQAWFPGIKIEVDKNAVCDKSKDLFDASLLILETNGVFILE